AGRARAAPRAPGPAARLAAVQARDPRAARRRGGRRGGGLARVSDGVACPIWVARAATEGGPYQRFGRGRPPWRPALPTTDPRHEPATRSGPPGGGGGMPLSA